MQDSFYAKFDLVSQVVAIACDPAEKVILHTFNWFTFKKVFKNVNEIKCDLVCHKLCSSQSNKWASLQEPQKQKERRNTR